MQRLVDLNESATSFKFEEASGEVDGQHVIGKISGPFFVPDGVSRNNRKYPKELWEKVCNNPNVRSRLQERRMFGTIGHKQKLDDEALLEGKMAIVTTNLQVRNGDGMGEALILATPAGKILNTVLRAGCRLFVSSRADGSFKGEDKGIPVVDPDTYQLEGFDVVLDPGFLQANPKLVEQFNQILAETQIDTNKGDLQMESKLIESMAKENATYKQELEKATTEIETLKATKSSLVSENAHLRGKIDRQQKSEKLVKQYEGFGNPAELEKFFDMAEAKLAKYKELGSFGDIVKYFTESEKLIKKYREIGSVKQCNEALDKAIKVVNAYNELGTPADIKKAFDIAEAHYTKSYQEKAKVRVAELAKELKVSEEKIKTVYGKITEAEIKKLFGAAPAPVSTPARTYTKQNVAGKVNENKDQGMNFMKRPSLDRLMESLGGTSTSVANVMPHWEPKIK